MRRYRRYLAVVGEALAPQPEGRVDPAAQVLDSDHDGQLDERGLAEQRAQLRRQLVRNGRLGLTKLERVLVLHGTGQ